MLLPVPVPKTKQPKKINRNGPVLTRFIFMISIPNWVLPGLPILTWSMISHIYTVPWVWEPTTLIPQTIPSDMTESVPASATKVTWMEEWTPPGLTIPSGERMLIWKQGSRLPIFYDVYRDDYDNAIDALRIQMNGEGTTWLVQPYAVLRAQASPKLLLQGGINTMYFQYTRSFWLSHGWVLRFNCRLVPLTWHTGYTVRFCPFKRMRL